MKLEPINAANAEDEFTVMLTVKRHNLVIRDDGTVDGFNDGSSCSYPDGIENAEDFIAERVAEARRDAGKFFLYKSKNVYVDFEDTAYDYDQGLMDGLMTAGADLEIWADRPDIFDGWREKLDE